MSKFINKYGYLIDHSRPAASLDEVGCEVFNPHDEAVVFELRMGLSAFGRVPIHEQRKVCKPEEFVYLPYGVKHYSTRWDRSGTSAEGITLHLNFGRDVGRGKKPDAATRAAIRRGQRRIY